MNNRHGLNSGASIATTIVLLLLLAGLSGCIGRDSDGDEDKVKNLEARIEASEDENQSGGVSAIAIVDGGEEPYTYTWSLDGDELLTMGPEMHMSGLQSGQHSIGLTVGSKDGQVSVTSVLFTISQPNRAPTCVLSATTPVYEGESSNWSLSIDDADGDNLNSTVTFDDGTSSQQMTGLHAWSGHESHTINASVVDADGLIGNCQAVVEIVANKAPELSVSSSPVAEGTVMLEIDEEIQLLIMTSDEENDDVSTSVNWGDGESINDAEYPEHAYSTPGQYIITINASDDYGYTIEEIYVEVVEGLNDSAAFDLFENQFSEQDPTAELDEDEDDTVDDAEDARNESGLDVDDTFAVDQNGKANHDEGRIDSWNGKDDNDVGSVADSNDTSGAGRDAVEDNADPIRNKTGRTNDNETEMESPIDNLEQDADIRDELFESDQDALSEVEKEDSMDADRYKEMVSRVSSAWFNKSFSLDHDGDGVNDTACVQEAAAFWVDRNHDGNAERAILYRGTMCVYDPDGDGVAEITFIEVEGLNWTDHSDDGTPEKVMALRTTITTWSNDSHTRTDDVVEIKVAAVTDLDQDGNLEYLLVGHVTATSVDLNSDGVPEGESINLNIAFSKDLNDDGTPEEAMLLKLEEIKFDLDGDGHVNTHISSIKILHVEDSDSDGHLDRVRAAQYGGYEWDNNSDGIVDAHAMMWLGVGIRDIDHDGRVDRVTMALGYDSTTDADGDGNPEKKVSSFLASRVVDSDSDGTFNHAWYVTATSERIDSDDDGLAESEIVVVAGARAWDWDDDGNVDRFVAIRYADSKAKEASKGIYQEKATGVWLLEVNDWNSDGSPNSVHAVKSVNVEWDNNSDGNRDTYWTNTQGWYGQDADHDGHWERQVHVEYTEAQSDDDADGEKGFQMQKYTIHLKHSSPLGMSHEWYYMSSNIKYNVSASGNPWKENSTEVAYESWNNSQKEETHAYVASYEYRDDGRDGTKEDEKYSERDNRKSS